MLINFTPIFSLTQSSQPARKPALPVLCKRLRCWVERRRARALRASTMPGGKAGRPYRTPVVLPCMHERRLLVGMLINFTPIFSLTQSSQPARKPARPVLCERLRCRVKRRSFQGEVSCAHLRADLEVGAPNSTPNSTPNSAPNTNITQAPQSSQENFL